MRPYFRALGATAATGLVLAGSLGAAQAGPVSGEIPTSVSEVVWSIDLPEAPRDIVATTSGAVALLGTEVVAIDAADGTTTWRYAIDEVESSAVLASPDRRSLLLVTSTDSATEIIGIDAATGEDRFVIPFSLDDPDDPDDDIAVTNDSFAIAEGAGFDVRAYSITDGSDLWTSGLPDECPTPVAWWGNHHSTPDGLIVQCGVIDASGEVASGGFVLLDSESGGVQWSNVRDRVMPYNSPSVGPDGLYVNLAFGDLDAETPMSVFDSIVSLDTGEVIAEGEFRGRLGYGGSFVHFDEYSANQSAAVFENLATGDRVEMPGPCVCSKGLAFLPDGILWGTSPFEEREGQLQFSNVDGTSTVISVPADFGGGPAIVTDGVVIVTDGDSGRVLGVN